MKKKQRILSMMVMLIVIVLPLNTQAVLQANANTHRKKSDTPENWIRNIRQMEKTNNAMGLEEKIDEITLTSINESNGIDVHMIKSTEWGTIAILSASSYGNNETIQNSGIKSTTGNKSGIYMLEEEFVAGGIKDNIFSHVNSKYYNAYIVPQNSSTPKIGDGLGDEDSKNPRLC